MKNFVKLVKELQDEIQSEGISINRSKILELYREYKQFKISTPPLWISRKDFLKMKGVL